MRIGIFGGSFDPVHLEHIHLAEGAVKSLALDLLLVLPAHIPPHKTEKTLASDGDRLEMCRIAFRGCPKIEVSDYEIVQGGIGYTYLTCRHFKNVYPDAELFWLVGTDMLRDFPSWREPEEILRLATLAVCARNEKKGWEKEAQTDFFRRFQRNFAVIGYDGKAVSSTHVRVYAAAGESVENFVGPETAKYIENRVLYEIPGAKKALSLEKPSRKQHSIRVALLAAERAAGLHIAEKAAVTASLFHDCAKNLPADSPYLKDFVLPQRIPASVVHQYAGAYVAEKFFGVKDKDVLNAIRFHTSGRADMSALEKLIFLSDMLESERDFEGVEALRTLFWKDRESLDECLSAAFRETLEHLKRNGKEVYPLTQAAYDFIKEKIPTNGVGQEI